MRRPLTIAIVLASTLACTASCRNTADAIKADTGKALEKTGAGIEKGGKKAGEGLEKASRKVGEGLEKAGEKVAPSGK